MLFRSYDGIAESQSISLADGGDNQTSTRTMPYLDVTKGLIQGHVIYDNVTTDSESVIMADGGDDQTSARTNLKLDNTKVLDSTHFNYDNVADNESVLVYENAIGYGYSSLTRTGLDVINMTKAISAGHYINDGVTTDDETVYSLDTDASSPTDLNRTTPAISLTTTFGVILADGVTSDTNVATAQDSGGTMDVNPYAEAGWFLNDGGLYVGNPIAFTG